MTPVRRAAWFLLLMIVGCTPPACADGGDGAARHDVKLVAENDGLIGQAAADRLARRGKSVIAVVETGLYAANPAGRRRIIRLLERIDPVTARPIFEHFARWDEDPDVRAAAQAAER
jgi:hypothetical protein